MWARPKSRACRIAALPPRWNQNDRFTADHPQRRTAQARPSGSLPASGDKSVRAAGLHLHLPLRRHPAALAQALEGGVESAVVHDELIPDWLSRNWPIPYAWLGPAWRLRRMRTWRVPSATPVTGSPNKLKPPSSRQLAQLNAAADRVFLVPRAIMESGDL
jgi:hypothetical protein